MNFTVKIQNVDDFIGVANIIGKQLSMNKKKK